MSGQQLTALVTGATGSIGSAITVALQKQLGARIFVTSRNSNRATEFAAKVGGNSVGLSCDLANAASIEECVAEVAHHTGGKLDILVNAAALNKDNLLLRSSTNSIHEVITANVMGSIILSKSVTKLMLKQRSGSLIHIGSVVGSTGNIGQCVYGASKASMIGFSKSFTKEYGPRGIRANVIEPGFIDCGMTDNMSEKARKEALTKIPLGRFGEAEDVANMAVFLADPEKSAYISGQVFRVDGGMV